MKKILYMFVFTISILNAQVGIGTSSPAASSQLDLTSTSKGFLVPRMNETQKGQISSPATGLLIYQTDGTAGFYYYTGSAWISLTSSSVAITGLDGLSDAKVGGTNFTGSLLVGHQTTGTLSNAGWNTGIGFSTLQAITSGGGNTTTGYESLLSNTTGSDNTANGVSALSSNTTGQSNIANGVGALSGNTTGSNNIAIGIDALWKNVAGSNATAIGYGAMKYANNTTTSFTNKNVALGYEALYGGGGGLPENNTGNNNTATGYQALYFNSTGSNNTANGHQALYSNTTGYENTANGTSALYSNTTGSNNTANGMSALYSNTSGNNNTANGHLALYSNITGNYNTANGYRTLYLNTIGASNTATGYQTLYSNTTGNYNTANGYRTLYSNTTGYNNTATGYLALYSTTGYNNTANGYNAGYNITTGINNTLIGYDAQPTSATVSNEITLGNSSITTLRAQVTSITALSDRRDKAEIKNITEGIDFVKKLNPVTFTWNTRDKAKVGIKSAGFIAQDLLELQNNSKIGDNLDLVSTNNPEKLEARYSNLLPVLVKAIQDLSDENAKQQKEIEKLKLIINKDYSENK